MKNLFGVLLILVIIFSGRCKKDNDNITENKKNKILEELK